jgi:hypothetical protein
MKNIFRANTWAVQVSMLAVFLSAIAILSLAQSNQDQDQPTATLSMNGHYSAEVTTWGNDMNCEDKITMTFNGGAQYKLLPAGYGTSNVHPEVLGTNPGKAGVRADRKGQFTYNIEGGGKCVSTKKGGGSITWTYGVDTQQVAPEGFPSVGIRLRAGDYNVDGSVGHTGNLTVQGQMDAGGTTIPWNHPGPAWGVLAYLIGQSIGKVGDATHGTFTPYSKGFTASNSVANTIEWPPTPATARGSGSMSLSYTLTFGNPEEVEAILIPEDGYDKWMPEGGPDEDTPGNTITVKVVLQKKGKPGSKTAEKAQFKFELENVSKEPGVCLNWPPKSRVKDPPDFDLKIVPADPKNPENLQNLYLESVGKDGQSAQSKPKQSEVDLTITSYDYGAWGKLKVTAILDDSQHTQVVAHLQDQPDVTELTIPQDDNENHVADIFERTYNPPNADDETSDEDNDPEGDGTNGDGLTLYEEYRGFMVGSEGGHIRTDPTRKDIFVRNRGQLPMDLFLLSNLSIHEIGPDEYARDDSAPNPAYINFNTSGFGNLGPQHVLRLINKNLGGDGKLGVTGDTIPGPPGSIHGGWVRVDAAECLSTKWGQAELLTTVAHELAHGCNVSHHGGGDYTGACFSYNGSPPLPDGYGEISVKGGVNSGEKDCIMRYEGTPFTQSSSAADLLLSTLSWHIFDPTAKKQDFARQCNGITLRGAYWSTTNEQTSQDVPEAPGKSFCTSATGRLFPKPGDATQGDCQHKFCINDNATCSFAPQ